MHTDILLIGTSCFFLIIPVICSQYIDNMVCYSKCLCLPDDHLISCDKSNHMLGIPNNIDPTFHRFMIQYGAFRDPFIYKKNLTGLTHLTLLKIIYCKLIGVESRAFEDMKKLKYLDLSHNNMRVIQPFTFIGLHLSELHLMENQGLILFSDSFKGMQVESINLRSNDMKSIDFVTFNEIKFQNLYLYNNKISVLNPKFSTILSEPNMLIDLTGNPLECNCETKWILSFLKKKFRNPKYYNQMKTVNFTCATPSSLAGKEMINLPDKEFSCQTPKIESISLTLRLPLSQLTCVAVGDRTRSPGVSWNYIEADNVKELRRNPAIKETYNKKDLQTALSINISSISNTITAFTCTTWFEDTSGEKLVVNLKLPKQLNSNSVHSPQKQEIENNIIVNKKLPLSDFNFFYQKHFTILEMLGAIIGTFVITLILLLMLIQILRWWKMSQTRQINYKTADIINPYWSTGHDSNDTYSQSVNQTEYDVVKIYESHPSTIRPLPLQNKTDFINYKTLNNSYTS